MTADPITTFIRDSEALLQQYAADIDEIVATFQSDIAAAEPHDTERPPPMFAAEEVNTLSPVVSVLSDSNEIERAG